MIIYKLKIASIILALSLLNSCNPFAPAFDDSSSDDPAISDLKTVDGVFQNFKYAYTFKDTVIYGEMIAPDFIFTFIDFEEENPVNVSWGRELEMRATYGLFQNSERLDIIWNNVFFENVDSLTANIIRGFNLSVTFGPTDVKNVFGRINLSLKKNPSTDKWQITRWNDESNF